MLDSWVKGCGNQSDGGHEKKDKKSAELDSTEPFQGFANSRAMSGFDVYGFEGSMLIRRHPRSEIFSLEVCWVNAGLCGWSCLE